MFELVFSEKVHNDIISALKYIGEVLEAPKAAENHYEALIKTYDELKENPFRRPLVHDKYLASKGIRSISVKNYILWPFTTTRGQAACGSFTNHFAKYKHILSLVFSLFFLKQIIRPYRKKTTPRDTAL